MAYLVLAYPELTSEDFDKIQQYREINDKLYFTIVNPHFTFVFPVPDIEESRFVNEIRNKSGGIAKFDFVIRCALINKDAFNEYYHTFLVPDEGYSQMVRIHDKLYSGLLKEHLRLDIVYVPHIGIGNAKDKLIVKEMVDEWNKNEFSIRGKISKLTIVNYEHNLIIPIESIVLK